MRSLYFGLVAAVLVFPFQAFAQQLYDGNQNLPPFGSFHGSDFDIVSLQNGNLHLRIPILSVPQRGKALSWAYLYDTRSWTKVWVPQPTPTNPKAGAYYVRKGLFDWFLSTPFSWGVSSPGQTVQCPTQQYTVYEAYVVSDPEGAKHPVPIVTGNTGVTVCIQNNTAPTLDGSGIWASYNVSTGAITLTLKDGTQVGATREDSNGNLATATADTLNRNLFTRTDAATVTYQTPLGKSALGPQYTLFNTTDTNGNSAVYRVDYEAIDLQTSFCGGGLTCHDFSGSEVVPSQFTLPNSKTYQFSWFNNSGGEIQQIALPTGGSVAYTYSSLCTTAPFQGGNPTSDCRRAVQTRTVTQNGQSAQWTYNSGGIVTDPYGNDEVHIWSYLIIGNYSSPGTVETKVQTYSGCSPSRSSCTTAGTLLRTITTDYTGEVGGVTNPQVVNVRPIRTTVTLDNGLVRKDETDYETFTFNNTSVATRLNPTEKREYDYGTSAPGALLRRTDYAYLHTGNQNYISRNIVDRATTITTYDGSGNQAAQTVNEYDNYSHANQPMQASGAIQHDSLRSTSFTYRGNLTGVSHWLNTTSSFLTTTNQYDDAGNILSIIDPLGHQTAFDFTDSWTNTTCAPSGQGKAYVTKITNALSQITTKKYNSCTASLASVTDPNLQITSLAYNDPFSRLTGISYPNGGQVGNTYDDTALIVTTSRLQTSSSSVFSRKHYDQLGRLSQDELCEDGTSSCVTSIKTDTTYDGHDRVASVSNPYRATSESTYGLTQYQYDALSRVTMLIPPDGTTTSNNVTTTYSGNCTTVTDEAGKTRKSCSDGLGRLTQVFEDPNGLNYETDYAYNALDNLTGITQKGGSTSANWRVRSFTYDSLFRLLTATNPESGTIAYTYDSNGNVKTKTAPAPNAQAPSTATVTTTYSYDVLNRLIYKSYSDSTPAAGFGYDESSVGGTSVLNPVGHLTHMTANSVSSSVFSYDPMGRVVGGWTCTPYNCGTGSFPLGYTYDLAGDMTSYTSEGITFTQTFDAAGRVKNLTSTYADAQHPATMATIDPSVGYWPIGAIRKISLGNGLTTTAAYNNRLQPCRMNVNSSGAYFTNCTDAVPTGNVQDFSYGFNAGTSDNGNLGSFTATGTQAFSRSYTYDVLNRLKTMSGNSGCTGLSWTYDAWGNRSAQTQTGGTCYTFSAAPNVKNQLTGYQYDIAGNLLNDGNHSYTYDAENRITQVDGGSTASYSYDAQGQRLRKTTSAIGSIDYIRNFSGDVLGEWQSGNVYTGWNRDYVYMGGKLLAEYRNATTYFRHEDHLGSARVITDVNHAVYDSIDYQPFGEQSSGDTGTTHKFTGKERDAESGLDNFGKRYDASSLGRFMTPDAFFKDSHVGDPQSWNEYAYARNNPLRYVDPTGETATVSSSCSTDANNHTTCNVNVSASISIYAQQGSNLSNQQLQQAAGTIQSSIQNAWSGSFTQDGVTYNVSTQVSVSVASSQDAAMSSGAQNVIGISNGNASATADSFVNPKILTPGAGIRGIDTGVWNINHLADTAEHEFTHLLGVGDRTSGAVLSNTNLLNDPSVPHHATPSDLGWGVREATGSVGLGLSMKSWYNGPALPNPFRFSTTDTVGAPWGAWWK